MLQNLCSQPARILHTSNPLGVVHLYFCRNLWHMFHTYVRRPGDVFWYNKWWWYLALPQWQPFSFWFRWPLFSRPNSGTHKTNLKEINQDRKHMKISRFGYLTYLLICMASSEARKFLATTTHLLGNDWPKRNWNRWNERQILETHRAVTSHLR